MAGRKIEVLGGPVTQDLAAGLALAKFLGIQEEMPAKIPLAGNAQLTLSSKQDVYYYTNINLCTCPAGANHKICYHRKDLCQVARETQKAEA